MLKFVRNFLFNCGLLIEPVTGIKEIERLKDCDLLGLLYKQKNNGYVVVDCPINKVRSWGGRKISELHPLVSTLNAYQNNKDIEFEKTQLFNFSQEYYKIINNAADSLRIGSMGASKLLDLDPRCGNYPWLPNSPSEQLERYFMTLKTEHKVKSINRYCSSKGSDYLARGERELKRLISTFESIKKHEYQRSSNFDGDVCANILFHNSKWVALITNGEHRVAALGSLGFDHIPIRVRKTDVVRLIESSYWPLVTNQYISKKSAEHVFRIVMSGDYGTFVNVYGWP
jgi:hypothetical protein